MVIIYDDKCPMCASYLLDSQVDLSDIQNRAPADLVGQTHQTDRIITAAMHKKLPPGK